MKNFPGNRFALSSAVLSIVGLLTVVSCGAATSSEAPALQAKVATPQVKDTDPAIDLHKLWGMSEARLTKVLGKPLRRVVVKSEYGDEVCLTFGAAKGFTRTMYRLRESAFNADSSFKGKTVCGFTGVLKEYVSSDTAPSMVGCNPVPKKVETGGAHDDWEKIVEFDTLWKAPDMMLSYFQVNNVGTPLKSNPLALKKGERVLELDSD